MPRYKNVLYNNLPFPQFFYLHFLSNIQALNLELLLPIRLSHVGQGGIYENNNKNCTFQKLRRLEISLQSLCLSVNKIISS